MSQMLELPDPIYQALVEAARANGVTPVGWIASRLPKTSTTASLGVEERQAALARLLQHTVSLGRATGVDNEQLDAELAREYRDPHDDPQGHGANP
jgi:hypothetical protein